MTRLSDPTGRRAEPTREAEVSTLKRLWERQVEYAAEREMSDGGMAYLAEHFAIPMTLERHLRAIDMMLPEIRGRVLEWGCRHALDSCVYRLRLGDSVELTGCDVCDRDDYRPFHEFSGIDYTRLTHPYELPYGDDRFDVATSNGVLEHVPDDRASLGELFRVIRPGGTLVITCLPNRYSYTEAIQRRSGHRAHDRLYGLAETRGMVRQAGFEVVSSRRFFMVPTMLNGFPEGIRSAYQRAHRLVWVGNAILERAWPLSLLASNLMVVARKPPARSGPKMVGRQPVARRLGAGLE